jgi:hypothetical protein
MTTYRYLFADLLTNQILAELPLTGVTFTQSLNTGGTFQGNILLSGIDAESQNVANATIPAKCAIYVDRGGVLVWGGVIWARQYDSGDQRLKITAQEFETYFTRRRITSTQVFSNVDQFLIAQTLVNNAQAVPNGNIGVIVPTNVSGINVSRTFYSYELKTVYSALLDLSRSNSGFDFNIQVAYDGGGNPTKTLVLSYPKSGTRYSTTSLTVPVFEFPAGNVMEYSYPEDGSVAANTIYVIGAGSNEAKLIATATDTAKIAQGWPVLEDSQNYSDFTDTTLLANLASAQVSAVSFPPTTLKIVSPPYVNPTLGSYVIGDDVRVRIRDDRFPTGLDATYRLVALSVTAGETSAEQVTLTLTLPTS